MENNSIRQIKQKLEFMNIHRIVSIDNEWTKNDYISPNTDIISFIEEMHPENEEKLLNRISNEGYITLQDAYDKNDEEIIKLAKLKSSQQKELPPSLLKLNKILTLLEAEGISVDRKPEYEVSIFQEYSTENCLFILDKEMDEENADIVRESIPHIIEEACNNEVNHLIIVYSSNIGQEYVSNAQKLEYVEKRITHPNKSNFYIYKMFAIMKGSDVNLEDALNQKISDCIYGDALYHYMTLEKKKSDDIYNEICKIENEAIAEMAEESIIEGNSIQDSIRTIMGAHIRIKENEHCGFKNRVLENFNFYQKNKYEDFISKHQGLAVNSQYRKYRESQQKKWIEKILNSEIATWENVDYSINKFYKDFTTGDIFKVKFVDESSERYLLIIENACDCIIRNQKNINDISRRRNMIKVLILEKNEITQENQNELTDENIIFPIKDGDVCCLKNTGLVATIPELLLDLCTLNENGKCEIEYEQSIISKYKNHFFEAYIKKPETKQNYDSIQNLPMNEFLKPNEFDVPEIEKDENNNPRLTRIGRLDYKITLRLCQTNYYQMEDQLLQVDGISDLLNKTRKTTRVSTEKIVPLKK